MYCHATPDPACALCVRAATDDAFRAVLEAVPPPAWGGEIPTVRPRLSFDQLAALNRRQRDCEKRKSAGLPCPDDPASNVAVATPGVASETRSRLRWAYAVTTIPLRRRDLLPRTLASLAAAGFDRPHLFVDGDRDGKSWSAEFGCPVTCRDAPNVRTAGHWVLSLYELYCRDPAADRYLVSQDDAAFVRDLRTYLDRCPYPERSWLNLYTTRENLYVGNGVAGWHEAAELKDGVVYHGRRQQCGRGAVALVFDRPAVVALLGSPHLAARPQDCDWGHRRIDGGVSQAMNQMGFREFVHQPSLVQHTGAVSSIGNGGGKESAAFPGETWSALSLLKGAAVGGNRNV